MRGVQCSTESRRAQSWLAVRNEIHARQVRRSMAVKDFRLKRVMAEETLLPGPKFCRRSDVPRKS
jgi:hypothetical protein